MAIEKLTPEKLIEYGFVNRLTTYDEFMAGRGLYYIDTTNKKTVADRDKEIIYTEIDGARAFYFRPGVTYFPETYTNLIGEFFHIKLQQYITTQKSKWGDLYDSKVQAELFNDFLDIEKDFATKRSLKDYIIWLKTHAKCTVDEPLQSTVKNSENFPFPLVRNVFTNRHNAIIYKYRQLIKDVPVTFSQSELKKQYGVGFTKALYTIWSNTNKPYRKTTESELDTIIPYLDNWPNAKKLALDDLKNKNFDLGRRY